jgi:hypothetical protein
MVVSCQQLRMARVFGKVTHWRSSSRLGNSVAGLLFTMGLAFGEPPKLILLVRSLDQTEVCNRLMPGSEFQRHASRVPRSIAEREDPQAVTVTAAARSAAPQRGLRGPVCEHRGSQHAARSADCGEELRGASAKRWRSAGEANAKRWLASWFALASARSAARAVHSIPPHGARRISKAVAHWRPAAHKIGILCRQELASALMLSCLTCSRHLKLLAAPLFLAMPPFPVRAQRDQ